MCLAPLRRKRRVGGPTRPTMVTVSHAHDTCVGKQGARRVHYTEQVHPYGFLVPPGVVTVPLALWSDTTHEADNIMWTRYLPGVAAFLLVSSTCIAELAPESRNRVEQLPAPNPHWVWVNDVSVYSMPDGKSHLIDGDSGRYLGVINTGYGFLNLTIPAEYDRIYAAETYYSRGTRGERTDLVSIYDPGTLSFIDEIVIPAKRASTVPTLWNAVLTDDQSFMLVFNLTPASSLSVVDLAKRSFAGEIAIPGCGLALPAGGAQSCLDLR